MSKSLEELQAAMDVAYKAEKAAAAARAHAAAAYVAAKDALRDNAPFTFEALKGLVASVEKAIPILGPGRLPEYGSAYWELCIVLEKARHEIETVEGRSDE